MTKPHPLQRSWDALLILHWRRDSRFGALAVQTKEMLGAYPEVLAKEGLLRASAFSFPNIHVRVWVDSFLHPLSVKLWDIEDNKRVLDWVNASTGLDCVASKKARRWQAEGRYQNERANLHMGAVLLSSKIINESSRRMSNPNQVKARGRK